MAVEVTWMMTLVGCSIRGSGTFSTLTFWLTLPGERLGFLVGPFLGQSVPHPPNYPWVCQPIPNPGGGWLEP